MYYRLVLKKLWQHAPCQGPDLVLNQFHACHVGSVLKIGQQQTDLIVAIGKLGDLIATIKKTRNSIGSIRN